MTDGDHTVKTARVGTRGSRTAGNRSVAPAPEEARDWGGAGGPPGAVGNAWSGGEGPEGAAPMSETSANGTGGSPDGAQAPRAPAIQEG